MQLLHRSLCERQGEKQKAPGDLKGDPPPGRGRGSGGYAFGNYSGTSSYFGSSSSTTTTYDAAAAYQAQVIASERVASYSNSLLSDRAIKEEGYLKRTTIYPGETISGYINIERKKGKSMTIDINIGGAIYSFPWNISK